MKAYRSLLSAAILAILFSCGGKQVTTLGSTPEIESRVEALLKQMTLAEKIGQMNQI